MKKILVAVASTFALITTVVPTQAATVAGNFNVTVNLTSVCTMGAITDLAFGTYVAFGAAKTATNTTATLTCTRGLTGVTAAFDTNATIGATGAATATNAVGAGVISGLQYDIVGTAGTVLPGNAATSTAIGTADTRPYVISGNMPAGQAGTCAATTCAASQVRTLTITY